MAQFAANTIVLFVLTSIALAMLVHSSPSMNQSTPALHQAPDECRWTLVDDQPDLTLVCRLRTINSELENTNFSVIQPQNTIRLRLECNEALFFQSSISEGSFRPLVELRSLAIHYCKIGNLSGGALQGLRELRNLTIRTHNTDWSTMKLELSDNVFTGKRSVLIAHVPNQEMKIGAIFFYFYVQSINNPPKFCFCTLDLLRIITLYFRLH